MLTVALVPTAVPFSAVTLDKLPSAVPFAAVTLAFRPNAEPYVAPVSTLLCGPTDVAFVAKAFASLPKADASALVA